VQLQGKVAIITGAATGIGRATALLFAREGASVVVADINEDDAQRTVADIEDEGGSARFVQTDVSEAEDMRALMERAAEEMGGIDVIVNNAGAQRSGAVTEFEESEWDLLMSVNPRSCFLGAKYGVPYLRERGRLYRERLLPRRPQGRPRHDRLLRFEGCDHRLYQGACRGTRP
jgi:NAD(P)-dependent dehydrogenase (short-subunit alcohol dehydrogenase family)